VPAFQETRELMIERRRLFREHGSEAGDKITAVNTRLQQLRDGMAVDFPLNAAQAIAFRENLSKCVIAAHQIEKEAISTLRDAMA
jgi:hypothetical protein